MRSQTQLFAGGVQPTSRSRLDFAPVLAVLMAVTPCASAATSPVDQSAFLEQVAAHFAAWDRDGNGTLSTDEIEQAVNDPAMKGAAAAAAVSLRRAIRANHSLDPLSLDQIRHDVLQPRDGGPKPPAYVAMYASAVEKIAQAKRDLFASGTPKLDSLGQGHLGDCFLLAGLGTLAQNDPERLMKMLQPKPGDMIEVGFANGRGVTIHAPTDAEICIGASTRNDGVWAITIEKAVGEVFLKRQKTQRHITPLSIIGVGGTPNKVPELVTGHQVRRAGCEAFQKPGMTDTERKTKLDELRAKLTATQEAGRMIVGGTAPIGKQAIVPGLYYNHSYGVLRYDAAHDEVEFWNPIGNRFVPKGPPGLKGGYPTSYGRFRCPLKETVMWFGSFSLETDEPLPE